ncbi:MAG: flagellar hook-basal body complex protein FliE [bacterium]
MAKINPLQQQQINEAIGQTSAGSNETGAAKFSTTLKDMINKVDELQKSSDQATTDFISGKDADIHEVMAAVEEAQLSFQLMMEIRNKLLDSYQEIMRMQV